MPLHCRCTTSAIHRRTQLQISPSALRHFAKTSHTGSRSRIPCTPPSPSPSPSSPSPSPNPLELLRLERDLPRRTALLAQLEPSSAWDRHVSSYRPCEVEQLLARELGVEADNIMMLAVETTSNPPLCSYDVTAAHMSLRALKEANVDVSDIWFLLSKRPWLLTLKEELQRWLDFLTVYGLRDKDTVNFLLRCSPALLGQHTLYQVGQVVTFLKGLGIKDEFLATRVFAVWPDVLCKDVETELRPVLQFLLQLGVEVSDVPDMVMAWPELLLCSVEGQLRPFSQYLTALGCSSVQVAEVLLVCPHLLGFKLEELFGHRLRALESIGIGAEDVRGMAARSLTWLTCSGGIQAPLEVLVRDLGLSAGEVRQLVLAAPGVLAEKDWELQRKWSFLQDELGAGRQLLTSYPQVMAVSLMQVLGPRVTFMKAQGQPLQLRCDQEEAGSAADGGGGGGGRCSPGVSGRGGAGARLLDLVSQEDEPWCQGLGLPYTEFKEHCVRFQTDFTEKATQDAAKEFQDELKKLGIYEGSD